LNNGFQRRWTAETEAALLFSFTVELNVGRRIAWRARQVTWTHTPDRPTSGSGFAIIIRRSVDEQETDIRGDIRTGVSALTMLNERWPLMTWEAISETGSERLRRPPVR